MLLEQWRGTLDRVSLGRACGTPCSWRRGSSAGTATELLIHADRGRHPEDVSERRPDGRAGGTAAGASASSRVDRDRVADREVELAPSRRAVARSSVDVGRSHPGERADRPRCPPRPRPSTSAAAASASAPTAATRAPTARPRCSRRAAIPQGDYAPVPWLLSVAGWAALARDRRRRRRVRPGRRRRGRSPQRAAAGPVPPAPLLPRLARRARCARFLPLTGGFARAASRVGLRALEEPRRLRAPGRRRPTTGAATASTTCPLDAIVIDSPWETQYNTWRFNPHQFPDAAGMVRAMRDDGVRTVVWVTPWVEPRVGRRPEAARPESRSSSTANPPRTTRRARAPATSSATPTATPSVGQLVDGDGLDRRLHLARGRRLVAASWRGAVLELGVEGDQGRRRRGLLLPARRALRRRPHAAPRRPGPTDDLYRRTTQESLDAVHGPASGVALRALRLDRPARDRDALGRRPGLGLLVAAGAASTALLTSAASGFSNCLARRRRLSRRAGSPSAAEPELLVRWAAVRRAVAAHAGARPLPAGGLDVRRRGAAISTARPCVLHERLVPYIRAAAATAERSGLPIMRPLCLVDPADPEGWAIADSYFLGPALWVAPVLEEGATSRRTYLPRGEWVCWWTRRAAHAAATGSTADAPLERIPLWVRAGSIVVDLPRGRSRPRPRRGGPRARARGDALGRAAARQDGRPPRRRDRDRLATRRMVCQAGAGRQLQRTAEAESSSEASSVTRRSISSRVARTSSSGLPFGSGSSQSM